MPTLPNRRVHTDPAEAQVVLAQQRPISRFIVKYRDDALMAAARRSLGPSALDRLAVLAGSRSLRCAPSGSACVVRLFHALPADQPRHSPRPGSDPASSTPSRPARQPMRVPNDPVYASRWNCRAAGRNGRHQPSAGMGHHDRAATSLSPYRYRQPASRPDLLGRYLPGCNHRRRSGRERWKRTRYSAADPRLDPPPTWRVLPGTARSPTAHFAARMWQAPSVPRATTRQAAPASTGSADSRFGCSANAAATTRISRWHPLGRGLAVPGVPANANPARVLNLSLAATPATAGVTAPVAPSRRDDAAVAADRWWCRRRKRQSAGSKYSPANCNGVVTVGATGRQGERAYYSNFGPLVESAPGGALTGSIWSTTNTGPTRRIPTASRTAPRAARAWRRRVAASFP